MMNGSILSVLTFLPLIAGLLLFAFDKDDDKKAKFFGLTSSIIIFILSIFLVYKFDYTNGGYQFIEKKAWIADGIQYFMGVDGISLPFILLTTFMIPLCILSIFKNVKKGLRDYIALLLILESMIIGVFCALDLVLFYVFFEASLIPMYLTIGQWGGKNRVYASFKFFLYTFVGSLLMLVALIYMYTQTGTTDSALLAEKGFTFIEQKWLWVAFFAAFAVKIPMFPVHTWLPDAHVEAPTAGSVILAAILLKMGGYGFIRFIIPFFPEASEFYAPLVFTMSVIAIIYASLVAFAQTDIKKLVAYSSIAHMGYVTLATFTMSYNGIQAAIFQMISHGFVSAALFFSIGVLYDRFHTRDINYYGGLAQKMPFFAALLLLFTMANVGLPGTSGFIGEFLTIFSIFNVSTIFATFAAFGVILSAAYGLWLYRKIMFGEVVNHDFSSTSGISLREKIILVPLGILIIIFGFYTTPLFDMTTKSVDLMINSLK
jgi:NADH-quinone oxidoreductase subunit M